MEIGIECELLRVFSDQRFVPIDLPADSMPQVALETSLSYGDRRHNFEGGGRPRD